MRKSNKREGVENNIPKQVLPAVKNLHVTPHKDILSSVKTSLNIYVVMADNLLEL